MNRNNRIRNQPLPLLVHNMEIVYRSAKDHVNADDLSKIPVQWCSVRANEQWDLVHDEVEEVGAQTAYSRDTCRYHHN